MGEEIEIDLRRMSPPEMLKRLKGQPLEEYRKELNELLAEFWSDLSHPVQQVRENAAWALTGTCIDRRDSTGLATLLQYPDPTVRQIASRAFRNLDPESIDATPFVAPLTAGVADSHTEVRANCAVILARHWIRHRALDRLQGMLLDDEYQIKRSAVVTVVVAAAEDGFDPSPLAPALQQLLGHDDKDLREYAASALDRFKE